MKAKLLKKFRKRFMWSLTDNDPRKPYTVYDKKLNKEEYCLLYGSYMSYNDMVIYTMCTRMRIEYVPNWIRRSRRFDKKKSERLKIKYAKN